MKRIFLFISNLLLALFLIGALSFWKDSLPQILFPGAAVLSGQADYSTVKEELNSLAKEHNSLIARTIWEVDSDGKSQTYYEVLEMGNFQTGCLKQVKKVSIKVIFSTITILSVDR